MPIGILHISPDKVNSIATICNESKNFDVSINDFLENIRILSKYILSQRKRKRNMKNNASKEELLAEIARLKKEIKKKKKYGLVWEDKPEDVVEQCKTELPVLKEVKNKEVATDPNKPVNILIEGDNYHALSVLNYTHAKKVDVIYIDPPYNTGAQNWRYNNDYVDLEDAYRHSKWISLMRNRLVLAKNLLSENGFIVCAIDANELFSLGLIMDEYFGEDNRLGLVTVLHNPKGRNFTRFFSANSEYMLVYSKNVRSAVFNDVAIDDDVKNSFDLTDKNGKKYRLEPLMRSRTETLRENKPGFWYPIYVSKDLKHLTLERQKNYYEVYPIATNGKQATWINLPETFNEKNDDSIFVAKKEGEIVRIYRKYYEQQILKNVWLDQKYQSEFHGTNLLKKILGENIFDYPKSLYLVSDILKITSQRDSVILDFFAGSGTTGHAVMELNKEDGGNRSFILCTNNENEIAEKVCYPRVKKVIEGYKNAKGEKVEGLGGNLKYFKTSFVHAQPSDKNRKKLTEEAVEMLCVKEGAFEVVVDKPMYKLFKNHNHYCGIVLDQSAIGDFRKVISAIGGSASGGKVKCNAYIFSLTDESFDDVFVGLNNKVKVSPIPEAILSVYRRIFK